MKRLTKKSWFGPKRYVGWGLAPRSWEGWTVSLVFITLILLGLLLFKTVIMKEVSTTVLAVSFIIIAFITGDKPGFAPR